MMSNDGQLDWDAPARDVDSVTPYEMLRRRPSNGEKNLNNFVAEMGNTDTSYGRKTTKTAHRDRRPANRKSSMVNRHANSSRAADRRHWIADRRPLSGRMKQR